nr:hypothetical protein CFP56_02270 [Quercus suber]
MDRECPIWLKGKHALKEANQQFRSWIRAATPNLARKSVVWVAGFEENDSETEDSEGSQSAQELKEGCDNTPRFDPALVVMHTEGAVFSKRETSRLEFNDRLQEIDREIA